MAVIVKGEITITKGFDHWKSMAVNRAEQRAAATKSKYIEVSKWTLPHPTHILCRNLVF